MKTPNKFSPGFSLIEVLLALTVFVISVLALVALLSVGLRSNNTSTNETVVSGILTALVGDLSATPAGSSSPQFGIPVPAGGAAATTTTLFLKEDGSISGTINNNANAANSPRYRATIVIIPASSASSKNSTVVRLYVTWPALADPLVASAPSHFSGSVETMASFLSN